MKNNTCPDVLRQTVDKHTFFDTKLVVWISGRVVVYVVMYSRTHIMGCMYSVALLVLDFVQENMYFMLKLTTAVTLVGLLYM